MNYTELETAIQDYCQNSETSFVSHINEFIVSAEDKTFEAMQGAVFAKFSTGISTVADQRYYSGSDGVPDGLVDITGIRLCETASGNIETGGPMRYLLVKDYDFLWEAYPGTTSDETGVPKYYAVKTAISNFGEINLTLMLAPAPNGVYNTEIEYQGKLSSDSITNGNTPGVTATTTTWISLMVPDVLLYGALVQAYIYMKGEADVMAGYEKQFQAAVMLLKMMTEQRQTTDTYKANDEGQGPQ
jgi:hypothetical protein